MFGPQAVSFVESLSLFQSVHYQRFPCMGICKCAGERKLDVNLVEERGREINKGLSGWLVHLTPTPKSLSEGTEYKHG